MTIKSLKEFYRKYICLWNLNNRWLIRRKYIKQLMSCFVWRDNVSILDVGCGCGQDELILSRELKKRGVTFSGTAIDLSKEALLYATKRVSRGHDWKFEECDFFSRVFEEKYDIVICSMVLMHYRDVGSFCRRISGVMKENGVLLLVVNNPYLIVDEYNVPYKEGISYTHKFNNKEEDVFVKKYLHTYCTYLGAALNAGLEIMSINEMLYSTSMHFFNDKRNNPRGLPNFISMVLKKTGINVGE